MTSSAHGQMPSFAALIKASELMARPNRNRLFVDVRLGEPEEELQRYRECHIFGAVHAQIRDVLSGPPGPTTGNLPLPDISVLESTLQQWGVDADTEVIVYGPSPALAARGWWVLKWAGVVNVRLLDGGLKAWIAEGGAVAQGEPSLRGVAGSTPLRLSPGHLPDIDVTAVERLSADTIVVDARDESSYLSGHLPGAIHLPASDQWTPTGTLRSKTEIAALYQAQGIRKGDDVVVYCGGGVLSALEIITLQSFGVTPRLYVGSWSEWCKSPARVSRSAEARRDA